MNKEKIAEITSMSLGLILFIGIIGVMIYSSMKYYYPNYLNNFIIQVSFEIIALVVVLLIYIKRIKKINRTI